MLTFTPLALAAALSAALTGLPSPQASRDLPLTDPATEILAAFDSAWVVALGERHGHVEFHAFVLDLLADPRAQEVIDDVAVEWGNGLYQGVMDRYIGGEQVPWDSVTMAWRNTVVSPNTVWDAPVYEAFFRGVRALNLTLPEPDRYRVVLADSPVEWSAVDSLPDLRPFFDRAEAMAETIRRESLLQGRRTLFLAGGLHVARRPRVRPDRNGVPRGEITPIAWLELRHPGSTFVVQSMGNAARLGLDELVRPGGPHFIRLTPVDGPGAIEANRTTTLRNRDGTQSPVYGSAVLAEIVDAVILWGEDQVTIREADPAVYRDGWYWDELNRRSLMLRGDAMDPELRGGTGIDRRD